MRRLKAGSRLRAEVGREDDDALVALEPLQQVVDLEVRVAIVAVSTSLRLPNSESASSKNSTQLGRLGLVEDRVEVLLGLADPLRDQAREVDDIRSTPSSPAITSAASVLPVPGAGEQRRHARVSKSLQPPGQRPSAATPVPRRRPRAPGPASASGQHEHLAGAPRREHGRDALADRRRDTSAGDPIERSDGCRSRTMWPPPYGPTKPRPRSRPGS